MLSDARVTRAWNGVVCACSWVLAQVRGKAFSDSSWDALLALRRAVGVLQHHDAVTGTEGSGLSPYTTPAQVKRSR